MKSFTSSVIIFVVMTKLILEVKYCFILFLVFYIPHRISNYLKIRVIKEYSKMISYLAKGMLYTMVQQEF